MKKEQKIMEARYSLPYNWMKPKTSRHFRQKNGLYFLIRKFISKKPKRILDVGCGDGWYTAQLVADYKESEVHGTDYSGAAVEFAKIIVPKGHFKSSSVTKLDYESDFFDTIISVQVLEHIPPEELPEAVSELARVLKKNGELIVSVPGVMRPMSAAHFQHFTLKSISETLSSHFELSEAVGQERHTWLFNFLERVIENRVWTLRPLAVWFNTGPYMRIWNETKPDKGYNLVIKYKKK